MELKTNGKKKGGSVLGGLILFIVGIGLLWWNEGRTVKTEGAIAEFEGSYIEVDSNKIDTLNNNKPIYTKGKLLYDELGSTDNEFNINVDSAVLKRTVEMYQWEEDCSTDSDGYETCDYKQVWSDDLIDSSNFSDSSHSNPTSKRFDSIKNYANYVKLDAFDIDYFKNELSTNVKYTNLSEDVASLNNLTISDGYYTSIKPNEPVKIGDIRISFSYNDAKELSIIGEQSGENIVSYVASNNYEVSKMREEIVTSNILIGDLRSENNILKWVFRFVGTLFVICGLAAIISPLNKLASYVPILGRLFNGITGLVTFVVGLCISLLVIAIAWFRFRPLLSVILIACGVGLVVLVKSLKKNKNSDVVATDAMSSSTNNINNVNNVNNVNTTDAMMNNQTETNIQSNVNQVDTNLQNMSNQNEVDSQNNNQPL